jgi:hypothetical protein
MVSRAWQGALWFGKSQRDKKNNKQPKLLSSINFNSIAYAIGPIVNMLPN